jgi:Amt family ammonium transporter
MIRKGILKILVVIVAVLVIGVGVFAESGPTPESNAFAINTIWTLLAGFLVFLMHAGFTCVEAGFTQSKNTVNIIMKNFMTISIGVLAYFITGFAFMFGPDIGGVIGIKGFVLTYKELFDFGIPTDGFWFFQAVFAATCATIVSGAVAERTKFSAYLIFTIIITSFTYPVVGHWIWGGGWLSELGFTDFAGSTVVHATGGFSALIAAKMVGARLGKYTPDGKVKAIPGHNIPLGALGVLILWFGWFGFNPGSTISGTDSAVASIAVTTILAGAAATVSSMGYSWLKYGKPDVSLTLNGCLAGLVGITAGCAAVEPYAAIIIGLVAGVVMILSVEFFDKVAKIDDPVGAISVHGTCGILGTLLVGIFATDGGLLYGGGLKLLGVQALGVAVVGGFVMLLAYIVMSILKATIGIRVSNAEQIEGLDIGEHGLSAYTKMENGDLEIR